MSRWASRELRGYRGTRTTLAMPAPRKKSAASLELSSRTATRSPGLSPSVRSPFAMRQPRSHALAKLRRSPRCTIASRSAKKVAARRIALVTSMVPSLGSVAEQLYLGDDTCVPGLRGRLRLIATLHDPGVIRKILAHLGRL